MKARTSFLLLSSATFTLLGACGDSDNSGGGGAVLTTYVGAGPQGGGGSAASCDLPTLDLDGVWAIKITLPVTMTGTSGSNELITCPASQDGDMTILMTMGVVSLDPAHSGQFSLCSLGLPTFNAIPAATCNGSALDVSYVRVNEGLFDQDTNPQDLAVASLDPGAAFKPNPVSFVYGTGAPLPSWDTAEPTCEDIALGHGGCEPTCVVGTTCDEIDGFDNDEPGFSFGICGVAGGENIENCNLDDPTDPEGVTLQGQVFSTFYLTNTFDGTFTTSCDATANVTTDFDMTYVGGDLYVDGVQISVTDEILGLPAFQLAAQTGTAHFVRIDGKHGAPAYATGDSQDTCDALMEHASEF